MKIKFFSNYDSSEDLLKRFRSNYYLYDDQLTFVMTNDYDFAVVFNGTNEPINKYARIITVIQEPSWSFLLKDTNFLTRSDYLIVHDPELIERTHHINLRGQVIESPAYMFYNDLVDHTFFKNTELLAKERKVSMIISGLNFGCANYAKRLGLLRKILASDLDIDIYGRGFNISDSRYKGPLEYKYTGLLPYEYSIAIENSNEKNYITEKFVDCTLCNTIPIYNGAPNISDVYDEHYFRWIDLDSPSVIEEIKKIVDKPAPVSTVNKDRYFNQYNLYTKLKEIIYSQI